jgi:hypothetical protein
MGTEIIRSTTRSRALLAFVILVPLLAGCSRSKPGTATQEAGQAESGNQSTGPSPFAGAIPGMRKTWGLKVMNRPGNVLHVQYSDNTMIVDLPTVARTLRGVSADHSIFLFQDSPALRQKLVPGKFVLFQGLDLRKVDALAVDGSTLIVGTETAPLREALKSAQIKLNIPVDFGELQHQLASEHNALQPHPFSIAALNWLTRPLDLIEPTVYASPSDELNGEAEFTDSNSTSWKATYHHSFNPNHTFDFDVALHRDAEGLNAQIEAKGHVTNFRQQISITTSDGVLKGVDFDNVGLQGNVDFSWAISTSEGKTPMQEARVVLPGEVSIPLDSTGLPMSLKLSEALLFHPAFTTKGEVAKGGFRVNYSGDEGFTFAGSNMETLGKGDGDSAIDSAVTFSPLASFGVVVAMAVPRVELSMGTEELFEMAESPIPPSVAAKAMELLEKVPIAGQWLKKKTGNPLAIEAAAYFQIIISTTAAASGMQSLVPCQQFTMLAKGQVGVDGTWLGAPVATPTKDIFQKSIVDRKPDAKICGGG